METLQNSIVAAPTKELLKEWLQSRVDVARKAAPRNVDQMVKVYEIPLMYDAILDLMVRGLTPPLDLYEIPHIDKEYMDTMEYTTSAVADWAIEGFRAGVWDMLYPLDIYIMRQYTKDTCYSYPFDYIEPSMMIHVKCEEESTSQPITVEKTADAPDFYVVHCSGNIPPYSPQT